MYPDWNFTQIRNDIYEKIPVIIQNKKKPTNIPTFSMHFDTIGSKAKKTTTYTIKKINIIISCFHYSASIWRNINSSTEDTLYTIIWHLYNVIK